MAETESMDAGKKLTPKSIEMISLQHLYFRLSMRVKTTEHYCQMR
ncbi:MAG: hypothetical protein ABH886_04700 [Candidatus Desantisbacteria bacterium]